MNRTLLLLVALLACFAFPAGSSEELVRKHFEARTGSALVALVTDGDERRVFAEARPGEANPGAVFEIGSITKVFNVMLLVDMVGRGEVAFDTRIGELLPGVALHPDIAAITLLELATHTSGLPRLPVSPGMFARLILKSQDPYAGTTRQDLIKALQAVEPGERGSFEYSNFGAALLGQLLAERAATPWEALLRERVLEPQGLTELWLDVRDVPSGRLVEARGENGRVVPHWRLDAYAPAGGMAASAAGLAGFVEWQMRSPGLWQAAAKTGVPVLGWMEREIDGERVLWHNGGTGGFRSFAAFLPGKNRGVVVLANGAAGVEPLGIRLLGLDLADKAPEPRWGWAAMTLLFLAIPPLSLLGGLWRWRVRKDYPFASRLQCLSALAAYAFLLAVSFRSGAFELVPIALAWVSLVLSVAAALALLPGLRGLGWRNATRMKTAASLLGVVCFGLLAIVFAT